MGDETTDRDVRGTSDHQRRMPLARARPPNLDILRGSSSSSHLPASRSRSPCLGPGTTADASNPFSAKLTAALWTAKTVAEGGAGDLFYTMNKEAAAPSPVDRGRGAAQNRETSTSWEVMNSSSAGRPARVASMPRRMAGTISSGVSIRSPWPPKARAIAA